MSRDPYGTRFSPRFAEPRAWPTVSLVAHLANFASVDDALDDDGVVGEHDQGGAAPLDTDTRGVRMTSGAADEAITTSSAAAASRGLTVSRTSRLSLVWRASRSRRRSVTFSLRRRVRRLRTAVEAMTTRYLTRR